MKVLDLFSGLCGWSAAFKDRGHEIVTVDNNIKFKPTICIDVMELEADAFREHFDVILASPPCNCFSIASVYRHWDKNKKPKDKQTKEAIKLVAHTLKLIIELNPRFWFLENPRGMLRKVIGMPTVTTYYAGYGTPYLKPTDIWGPHPKIEWNKPTKWIKAPRGSKTGIQGIDGKYIKAYPDDMGKILRVPELRAIVPYALSQAVCLACERELVIKI